MSYSQTSFVEVQRATVVVGANAGPVAKRAARMLVEMANERGGAWRLADRAPASGAVVYLGPFGSIPSGSSTPPPAKLGREGYQLIVRRMNRRPVILASGRDDRGCLFAAGHIVRLLRWSAGPLRLPVCSVATSPAKPMRGHQLGWRPTANSYDRWGLKEYERYIRELILWGTNAIELIPFDSAYDREENTRFTCALADLIASYGLDVWLWYPLNETVPAGVTGDGLVPGEVPCPSRPDGRRFILERFRQFFRRIKHLDAVLFPGGDPAGCGCEKCRPWVRTMLPLAQEIAAALHESHPQAGLWLTNQGFLEEHNRYFYDYVRREQPRWLAGLAHGPWAEETIQSMRNRAPARYPVRQYPDICHCVRCQYPVPDWDQAFAATLGREPVIYRPTDHAHIARMYQRYTVGAITYSDGVTDDLNKVIWSAILWNPALTDETIVREYVRCFFGERAAQDAYRGIRLLEANWKAPVLTSRTIPQAYDLWRRLERSHPNLTRANWRFQMALLRAYYDRYVQIKLQEETDLEAGILRDLEASRTEPVSAARRAIASLDAAQRRTPAPEIRERLLELGEQLFRSIGLQLSVPRWGASGSERGAVLDFLDVPLRNQEWIRARLNAALQTNSPDTVKAAIEEILRWEDPGPGGFYDDLGNPLKQPHLVRPKTWREDPGYVESVRTDFAIPQPGYRQSWVHYAESLYGTPIVMKYTGLDPKARYFVRATYSGRYRPMMELWADDRYRVHGPEPTTVPPTIKEWPVPREATADGQLTLRWTRLSGRGAQVSEVWLIRRDPDEGMGE